MRMIITIYGSEGETEFAVEIQSEEERNLLERIAKASQKVSNSVFEPTIHVMSEDEFMKEYDYKVIDGDGRYVTFIDPCCSENCSIEVF